MMHYYARNRYFRYWTPKEDEIVIALRNDGFTLREISVGLFNRSMRSVTSRMQILRRSPLVR